MGQAKWNNGEFSLNEKSINLRNLKFCYVEMIRKEKWIEDPQ